MCVCVCALLWDTHTHMDIYYMLLPISYPFLRYPSCLYFLAAAPRVICKMYITRRRIRTTNIFDWHFYPIPIYISQNSEPYACVHTHTSRHHHNLAFESPTTNPHPTYIQFVYKVQMYDEMDKKKTHPSYSYYIATYVNVSWKEYKTFTFISRALYS